MVISFVMNTVFLLPLLYSSVSGLLCYHMNRFGESLPAHCRGYCASISARLAGGNQADVNYCIPERICLASKTARELGLVAAKICKGISKNTQETGRIISCKAAVCQKHLCNDYNFKTSVAQTNCSLPTCYDEPCYDGPQQKVMYTTKSKPSPTTASNTLSTTQINLTKFVTIDKESRHTAPPKNNKTESKESDTATEDEGSITSNPETSTPKTTAAPSRPTGNTDNPFIEIEPDDEGSYAVNGNSREEETTTVTSSGSTTWTTTATTAQKRTVTTRTDESSGMSATSSIRVAPPDTTSSPTSPPTTETINTRQDTSQTGSGSFDVSSSSETSTGESNTVEPMNFVSIGVSVKPDYNSNNVAQTHAEDINPATQILYSSCLLFLVLLLTSL